MHTASLSIETIQENTQQKLNATLLLKTDTLLERLSIKNRAVIVC